MCDMSLLVSAHSEYILPILESGGLKSFELTN